MSLSRRGLLGGLLAAPFVVRSGVLMPVKKIIIPDNGYNFSIYSNGKTNWYGADFDPMNFDTGTLYKMDGSTVHGDRETIEQALNIVRVPFI